MEELLHDLNGSAMFSKVVLKWGLHQILLCQESRHINTFATSVQAVVVWCRMGIRKKISVDNQGCVELL